MLGFTSIPRTARRRRPSAKAALAGAILLFGLVLAYAVGRFTAPGPAAPIVELPPVRLETPPPPELPRLPPPRPPAAQPSPVAAAAPQSPPDPVAEVVAQVTQQAKVELENLRPRLMSSCWPSGGLGAGQRSATLTFHMTFDAQGHEIARGISESRRAVRASAEFAKCVRILDGTLLSIPPPGRTVAISIPVSFP